MEFRVPELIAAAGCSAEGTSRVLEVPSVKLTRTSMASAISAMFKGFFSAGLAVVDTAVLRLQHGGEVTLRLGYRTLGMEFGDNVPESSRSAASDLICATAYRRNRCTVVQAYTLPKACLHSDGVDMRVVWRGSVLRVHVPAAKTCEDDIAARVDALLAGLREQGFVTSLDVSCRVQRKDVGLFRACIYAADGTVLAATIEVERRMANVLTYSVLRVEQALQDLATRCLAQRDISPSFEGPDAVATRYVAPAHARAAIDSLERNFGCTIEVVEQFELPHRHSRRVHRAGLKAAVVDADGFESFFIGPVSRLAEILRSSKWAQYAKHLEAKHPAIAREGRDMLAARRQALMLQCLPREVSDLAHIALGASESRRSRRAL